MCHWFSMANTHEYRWSRHSGDLQQLQMSWNRVHYSRAPCTSRQLYAIKNPRRPKLFWRPPVPLIAQALLADGKTIYQWTQSTFLAFLAIMKRYSSEERLQGNRRICESCRAESLSPHRSKQTMNDHLVMELPRSFRSRQQFPQCASSRLNFAAIVVETFPM